MPKQFVGFSFFNIKHVLMFTILKLTSIEYINTKLVMPTKCIFRIQCSALLGDCLTVGSFCVLYIYLNTFSCIICIFIHLYMNYKIKIHYRSLFKKQKSSCFMLTYSGFEIYNQPQNE